MDDDKNPITFIANDPTSLHSATFLTKPDEHGEQRRARVTEIIGDWEKQLKTQQDREEFLRNLQYRVIYEHLNHHQKPFDEDNPEDSAFDDLLTYNEVVGYINKEVTDETGEYWQFREILGFQHTPQGHKDRMGSKYNVKMLWETGEITYEPLDFLARDIPVELARFAMDNDLLDKPGWKRFKQ